MTTARYPRWMLFTLLVWLIAASVAVVVRGPSIAALDMPDTDDAQRLVQVRDWLGGQAWGDVDQRRMNPPLGGDMHWSRVVDLPIAAIRLGAGLVASDALAERAAVALAPLLALLAAMLMAALAGARLGGPKAASFAMLFVLATGPLLPLFAPLRIDHHNWQIALLIGIVAMFADPRRRLGSGVLAGLMTLLTAAIGLEMLPHLVAASAALVLGWVVWPDLGRMLRGYGIALAAGTVVAYPAFVPTARWMVPLCDALSPVYFAALLPAGCVAALLPTVEWLTTSRRRLTAAIIGFGAVGAGVLAAFPHCAAGPLAALDPAFLPVLSRINEARPLLSHLGDKPATIVYYAVYPAVGIACALWLLRRAAPAQRFAPAMILTVMLASSALMFVQLRAVTGPNALAAILAATVAAELLPRARAIAAMPRRLLATLALFVGLTSALPTFAALAVGAVTGTADDADGDAAGKPPSCTAAATLAPLAKLPPATIANVFDMGPALLLHTPHTVMAGPYHRNAGAIADSVRLWRADDAAARAIIARYGARYVLACEGAADLNSARRTAPTGLWARLHGGQVPGWLAPVALPAESPLRLYRVTG